MTPVSLLGTTASGKSAVALAIARRDPSIEIVSIDSMQVYRGMDIGTAKPTRAEQGEVRHHLIDLVDPSDEFSVVEFRDAYDHALADIEARGKQALLVGGTGLHLRAVVERLEFPAKFPEVAAEIDRPEIDTVDLHRRLADLDPLGASRMEPSNRRRVVRALEVTIGSGRPFSSFGPGLVDHPPIDIPLVGLRLPVDLVRRRIADRYAQQIDAGFVDEVRALLRADPPMSKTARQALGYRELASHIEDGVGLEDAVQEAVVRTRRFARRQRSWFRRDPRIRWIDVDDPADAVEAVWSIVQSVPK